MTRAAVALLLLASPAAAQPADVAALFAAHCVKCHGPDRQGGKLRLDTLPPPAHATKDELAVWASAYEQLVTGRMPPADAPPAAPELRRPAEAALRADLVRAGVSLDAVAAYPVHGNLVDHDALFTAPATAAAFTPARVWRLSPFAYRRFADDLTGGRLIVQGGPAIKGKQIPLAPAPFGLTTDPGFRDYAFRYRVSGSEAQQLAANARVVLDGMLTKRPRFTPPPALTAVANSNSPTPAQLRAAVRHLFDAVLYREPSAEERERYAAHLAAAVGTFGSREGLVHGLAPVFLHPEAVFRSELGAGPADEHGRRMLTPTELAVAIAYALTDARPDAALLAAARSGRLATAADVRREVSRLLIDVNTDKPRILRFFQEYFGYDRAPEVFKDPRDLKAAGFAAKYDADPLVADTDALVRHVLAADRDVLRQLLTTDQSFVGREFTRRKGNKAVSPFGTRPGQNQLYRHYNFDPAQWSAEGRPVALPRAQRAGILTQPAWLIAHSANSENHAIHRGRWVREKLLGGSIPDTPITVDAQLPDEPEHTLRQRMRVTREAYCWRCHRHMDPLGLPFEVFDHLGQHRATELGKPVDASGEVIGGGDPALDGPVTDALELIRRLAASERVHQVFVRHAFRYWLGRNETPADAATLWAAYRAYADGGGSMKELLVSLLSSDSFLYRR